MIKILFVEEGYGDPVFPALSKDLDAEGGYELENALNGQGAIKLLQVREIDLIILGIKTHDKVDGLQVLRFIKESRDTLPNKNIKSIVLTSLNDLKNRLECIKLNAGDIVEKPYDREKILAAIKRVLP